MTTRPFGAADAFGALATTESRPGKQRQAQVDGGGIQCVGGLLQLDAEPVGRVQPPRVGDQDLGEIGVNSPVAPLVGFGQRVPGDRAAEAGVVELLGDRAQAGLDVPQALAIGQLGEGHAQELVETREVANPSIAVIPLDAAVEGILGQEVHQLGEDVAIGEHEAAPSTF